MAFLGQWEIDDLLTFCANTHDPTTGGASDADSVPTYRIYEDETGTAILTGSMALLDDANTTGFYSEQITLSAANGFENGKQYTIYIQATVSAITGTTHHTFQVDNKWAAIQTEVDKWSAADAEPTGVPAANESPLVKLAYLFMALRNKVVVTGAKKQFYDDGDAVEWEKDLSDDGSTYTETEANAP